MPVVQSIYHTGFIVENLDRALEFYTQVLGMDIEREPTLSDTPWLSEVVGYPDVIMRQAYVGVGDGHSIELIEYITQGAKLDPIRLIAIGPDRHTQPWWLTMSRHGGNGLRH
ncbi:MAG: hypothetical protein CM1200mP39_07920 [Dehalococcoidia bacterium]|nr:MAG: hypothetical protein CM1200mP39_07920 [Dehalococcoidia bacterium]